MNNAPNKIDLERLIVEQEGRRKTVALYLAVGVSLTVVLAAWLFLLPNQLQGMRLLTPEEEARWQAGSESFKKSKTEFMQALDVYRKKMDEEDARLRAQVPSRDVTDVGTSPATENTAIGLLRERVSQLMEQSEASTENSDIQSENHATQAEQ